MTTPQKNSIVLVVVALVVAGMIYTGAKHSRRRPQPAGEDGMQSDLRGRPAPDFELTTLEGKKVKLSELRGKAVIVNFWATWCGPCKLEMPWLVDLQNKYADKGLVILGLSVDEGGSDTIATFAKEMGVNYPVLRATDAVSNLYGGIDGLPTTFYIGRDGNVIEQAAGIVSKSEIEDNIKLALAHGAPAGAVTANTPVPDTQKDVKAKP